MSTPTAPLPFLGEDDLALLHACGAEIQARRGEILIREGETTTDLLLAVEGVIAIETDGVAIAHCGPGEVWGEISMLEDAAASATAVKTERRRIMVLLYSAACRRRRVRSMLHALPAHEAAVAVEVQVERVHVDEGADARAGSVSHPSARARFMLSRTS